MRCPFKARVCGGAGYSGSPAGAGLPRLPSGRPRVQCGQRPALSRAPGHRRRICRDCSRRALGDGTAPCRRSGGAGRFKRPGEGGTGLVAGLDQSGGHNLKRLALASRATLVSRRSRASLSRWPPVSAAGCRRRAPCDRRHGGPRSADCGTALLPECRPAGRRRCWARR